jgi:hypothetical protein
MFDSLWRAFVTCLHPKILAWSLLPLLLAGAAVGGLGFAYWESTVATVRGALERWELVASLLSWLDSIGAPQLRTLMAPLIVVALSVPLVVVLSLLLVGLIVTPAVVRHVAERRFATLERREGTPWWKALVWSAACTVAAMLALALSVPLWFVPPLVLVVPPLIWGWLTARVFAYEALAGHASVAERRSLMRSRRWTLLAIGVACGYLGALPSLLWAASAATLIFAPILALLSVWLYTMVFAFAACWFTHYALAELQALRAREPLLAAVPLLLEEPAL